MVTTEKTKLVVPQNEAGINLSQLPLCADKLMRLNIISPSKIPALTIIVMFWDFFVLQNFFIKIKLTIIIIVVITKYNI